jgi:hypothetical protein
MTVTVLSGPERRRRWAISEKQRIVEESLAGEASAAEVQLIPSAVTSVTAFACSNGKGCSGLGSYRFFIR